MCRLETSYDLILNNEEIGNAKIENSKDVVKNDMFNDLQKLYTVDEERHVLSNLKKKEEILGTVTAGTATIKDNSLGDNVELF